MKNMKKLLALVLAAIMMMALCGTALADEKVTITVNRDSTYAGVDSDAGRAYTWYKIFSATYDSSVSSNASGYTSTGAPNVDAGGASGITYYASASVATALEAAGNLWFDLQAISGSTDKIVTWKSGVATDAATLQAAADWLIANNAYEETGSMTFNGTSAWTASVDKGYYVIAGDVGDNMISATTNITVNEKNAYPPITKEQADEDDTTMSTTERSVAVGDTIDYEVSVTIPVTAAVGDTIVVYDTPSAGLDYNDDVAVTNTAAATVTAGTPETGEAWRYTITVTAGSQGKDVVFNFSMDVTEAALTDTVRQNEAQLKYGNNYTSLPQDVHYTTYFTGVHKINGETPAVGLQGVKFDLYENGVPFNVTKVAGKDYYIPGGSSNEVETDADGYIKIRGLDNDKPYTLTETYTLPGYNMLEGDVTLALVEDKGTAYENYDPDAYQNVVNNQGTTLPSTGGIGTTIFYAAGLVLVLGAAVVLISRRKAEAED